MTLKMLELEDLVANALIELIEDKGIRQVSFKQLDLYKKSLYDEFKKINIRVVIPFTDGDVDRLISIYDDFFEEEIINERRYITLKDNKNELDLRKYFRSYLPLNIIKVFYDTKTTKCLFEN